MKQFNIIMIYTISHNSRIIKLLKKKISVTFDVQTKKRTNSIISAMFSLHFFLLAIVEHVISGGINIVWIISYCPASKRTVKQNTGLS